MNDWLKDLLLEMSDDFVSLQGVVNYVRDAHGEGRAREETFCLLRQWLENGTISAGTVDSNGQDFHRWPVPAGAVMEYLQEAWDGRPLQMGEIAWFTSP